MSATQQNVTSAISSNFFTYAVILHQPNYLLSISTNRQEGTPMLENVIEFFKNLPAKTCAECGKEIEEQHECYSNKCDECNII